MPDEHAPTGPESHPPILWSFRRCPYAIRARMAILRAGIRVELREILLRDKPAAFLEASPSATVPALETPTFGLDESLEIMEWALGQNDPDGLMEMTKQGRELIQANDGPFKAALDHTKYAAHYPQLDPIAEREHACYFIRSLEAHLSSHRYLVADRETLADLAIFPFIRQFANIDRAWFDAQPWPNVKTWLQHYFDSKQFDIAMAKQPLWRDGAAPVIFGS